MRKRLLEAGHEGSQQVEAGGTGGRVRCRAIQSMQPPPTKLGFEPGMFSGAIELIAKPYGPHHAEAITEVAPSPVARAAPQLEPMRDGGQPWCGADQADGPIPLAFALLGFQPR